MIRYALGLPISAAVVAVATVKQMKTKPPTNRWRPEPGSGPNNRLTRAAFLARSGAALLAAMAGVGASQAAESPSRTSRPTRWKGKRDSKVKRWDIITIGNLSRNRYWGESDERGVRPAICTCTLIQGEAFRIIVDPSLAKAEEMAAELDRRTGLKSSDINAVFVTHEHGDHFAGLAHFPDARWLAAPAVAQALNQRGRWPRQVEAVTGRFYDAVEVIPTPGHTPTHHSLRFDSAGLAVVVAGDAVPTRDYFRERRGYYNAVDFEVSARTMDELAAMADVIVPGHDNYFLADVSS